jgi:hypothetical protein
LNNFWMCESEKQDAELCCSVILVHVIGNTVMWLEVCSIYCECYVGNWHLKYHSKLNSNSRFRSWFLQILFCKCASVYH